MNEQNQQDVWRIIADIGIYQKNVAVRKKRLIDERIIERIFQKDYTVWKTEPTEIVNRLGWLQSPTQMKAAIPEITEFVDHIRAEGFTHALLLGMGGSSLAPEVFRYTFGVRDGYLKLSVLDSTDPGYVLASARKLDQQKTLYIVSTKSGGTIETISFMKYFYNTFSRDRVGEHFIAITDPGSGLEKMAMDLKFRKIFRNDPQIGGRYSALSYFGLVPAALLGIDLLKLLDRAEVMLRHCREEQTQIDKVSSAALLGIIMGDLTISGRDKLTFILSPSLKYFGAWLEQLIAESTGKEGKGILPIDGEELLSPVDYAHDRTFIYLKMKDEVADDEKVKSLKMAAFPVVEIILNDVYDLGGEFVRWEMATAIASWCLQVNPFDQPNVESAKKLAHRMMETYRATGKLPSPNPMLETDGIKVYGNLSCSNLRDTWENFIRLADSGENSGRSYVACHAYLHPKPEVEAALQQLRSIIQRRYRIATTVGYGPRFLHSTGQLHKGDAGYGLFIQFTAAISEDAPIPDVPGKEASAITFGILELAQALGDGQALLEANRNLIRFDLGADVLGGLQKIIAAIK